MSAKRIYRFAYHASQISDVRMRAHQVRDGDAFLELLPLLTQKGYRYEGLLLNPPSEKRGDAPVVDISFLSASDLIVLTTRPPLHDIEAGDKRPIRRSFTKLEDLIFDALRPKYLTYSARSRITLSEAVAQNLKPEFKEKADIIFHSAVDSSYVRYRSLEAPSYHSPARGDKRTAAYLIQVPAIWPDGPRLLVSFAMAGTETLIWNHLLRTPFSHWLESHEFMIAEFVLRPIPEKPVDLSFAADWEPTPML